MAIAIIQLRTWLLSIAPDHRDDRGASLVEYALMLALIAAVCIVAVGFMGEATSAGINSGAEAINP